MSCFYILDINLLSVISFANIFSHSIGHLHILLVFSFVVQKILSLIRSNLFFAFISFALGGRQKLLIQFISKSVLPVFFFRNFRVSSLRSLSHFEFIVHGVKKCSNLIVLPSITCFSLIFHHCLFSSIYSWLLCCSLINHSCVSLFMGFLFCYIDPDYYIVWF